MAARKSFTITHLCFIIFCFFIFPMFQFHGSTAQQQPWIKAGFWDSGSDYPVSDIDSSLFTHVVCGFAAINSSTYQLSSTPSSFRTFTAIVRRRNPTVTTLLSVWNGQHTIPAGDDVAGDDDSLFAVVSTPSHRSSFIESAILTARLHGFEGIDLSWIWHKSTDPAAMGPFLDEFRAAIDSESENSNNSKLTLTMAVRRSPNFGSLSYPVQSMVRNLDWAHLFAYDYHLPTRENFTANHAALFNPSGNGRNDSTDAGVREWIRVGFPATKLVLGLAYHGYAWKLANPRNNSLGAPAAGPEVTISGEMGYKLIKSFIQNYGFGARATYNSSYVINSFVVGSTWINFDGVEAITAKVSYAVEMGLAGFIAFEVGNDDNWELSRAAQLVEVDGIGSSRPRLLKILLPIAAFITLSAIVLCYIRNRVLKKHKESVFHGYNKGYNNSPDQGKASRSWPAFFGSREPPNLQVFTFSDINAATSNFSEENLLGSGGFGPVYKGVLPGGEEIAVKRLSESSTQGIVEFRNEVSLTARLQHVNLVRVVGFCTEKEEKMLVYEFMANRSLDFYLFDPVRRLKLDWNKRVGIIEGVTQGLLYLQEYSNFTIIHRDLKGSNILLDDAMNAKISDFGMARLFTKGLHEANTSRIVGTYGYVPPEYVKREIYSMKYDVYSFGVVLLQIISSKRTQSYYGPNEDLHLSEHAYESWLNGEGIEFFDPTLDDSSSYCKLTTCLQLGLLCVQEDPDDRPAMLEVSSALRGGGGALTMATPRRPAFSSEKGRRDGTGSDEKSRSRREVCSFNDDDVSQVEPR